VPSHSEVGSNTELADRVKSILATKQLTLHQASQRSSALFARGSPYYLPHNLYYDLSHGHFSPSLFQLVALSQISNYRLRDWLQVFGFDIEAIPRLQIQFRSKRTALLESSLDDPSSHIPWFRSLHTGSPATDVVPLAHLIEWTGPRRAASLSGFTDGAFLYAQIGSEDVLAFPELLPGSIVRVNPALTGEALKQVTAERSAHLFLIEHERGLSCCHVRLSGHGRMGSISNQLLYARMEFSLADEARIVGVADLEIRNPSCASATVSGKKFGETMESGPTSCRRISVGFASATGKDQNGPLISLRTGLFRRYPPAAGTDPFLVIEEAAG
jgi:hypothetical protein